METKDKTTNRQFLTDNFGRRIDYLRIAITDRCNLRCRYCMPENGIDLISHNDILSFEEFERLVKIFGNLGIKKVRITGGEPLVRLGVFPFIRRIKSQTKIETLCITTNGVRTARYLDKLSEIELDGINLSLDTLRRDRFQQITRRDEFDAVWETFQKTIELKIPLKINAVIQNGFNTDEIIPMAKLAENNPIDVRFIEEMPFNGHGVFSDKPFSQHQILDQLQTTFPKMKKNDHHSTAVCYQIPDFAGTIGIIGAYSRSFCGSCNRIRITPTGMLKTCLYDGGVLNLKTMLRNGASDEELVRAIHNTIQNRNKDGFVSESKNIKKIDSMAKIGG